jgi:hypothetical protein
MQQGGRRRGDPRFLLIRATIPTMDSSSEGQPASTIKHGFDFFPWNGMVLDLQLLQLAPV